MMMTELLTIAAIAWLLCSLIVWLLWYPVRHQLGARLVWGMTIAGPLTLVVAVLLWLFDWLDNGRRD